MTYRIILTTYRISLMTYRIILMTYRISLMTYRISLTAYKIGSTNPPTNNCILPSLGNKPDHSSTSRKIYGVQEVHLNLNCLPKFSESWSTS